MLIWCDVNEKIAVAGLIWGRKKHQGPYLLTELTEQRIHEEHPNITVSWQQQWATSGSLLEICKYLDRAPNCEPVVVTVWFGKLVPLKITGWSFAHHPFQTTTHYPDFTQFKQLQKGDPPSPQNIVQNIKSVLYLVFWFWISLGLVTPFVDLVSRIRTKGLCAALVWIHLTFSRGFTQFANYKNCKYLDQKIYKNDIVHILCS